MKSEIINVGTELLLGDILNTNSRYLSKKLAEIGIDVFFHSVVGDNKERLKSTVITALNRSDLIIITGGLGPTKDDITKEVICEVLDLELILDNNILSKIKCHFKSCLKGMPHNNIKQAYIPKGSKILPNQIGTAPGFIIEENGKIIALLPGPPKELSSMFENYLQQYLSSKSKHIIKSLTIKTIGIGESDLEMRIKDIIENQSNPTIATYAKEGQVEIRITAKATNEEVANCLINNVVDKITPVIKDYIYSYNNETLEELVYRMLLDRKLKIGFCESCTGGLIASRFTRIPGVSKVFEEGIITYSNESKLRELGVRKETLQKYGAVSKETALEMAIGLKKKSKVDIALSVTGIAGPTGGTKEKPVGLVFIGLVTDKNQKCIKYNLKGNRTDIQKKTADRAFNEIRKLLLNLE
jgi:nicotinamide-nucleotide amidase